MLYHSRDAETLFMKSCWQVPDLFLSACMPSKIPVYHRETSHMLYLRVNNQLHNTVAGWDVLATSHSEDRLSYCLVSKQPMEQHGSR